MVSKFHQRGEGHMGDFFPCSISVPRRETYYLEVVLDFKGPEGGKYTTIQFLIHKAFTLKSFKYLIPSSNNYDLI